MIQDTAWVAALQRGDKVIVHHGGVYGDDAIYCVDRVTAKQILIVRSPTHTQRFWRENGVHVTKGSTWSARSVLHPWSPEASMRLAIKPLGQAIATALQQITRRDCDALPSEHVRAVVEALRTVRTTLSQAKLMPNGKEESPC